MTQEMPVGRIFDRVTDEEVERVRDLVGRPLEIEQWNHEASYDSIRHWCYGIGDDNPLWNDELYAARGPYGGMVAPPTFLFSVFGPSIRPGFAGLPSIQGGGRLDIDRYVRRGERLVAEAKLVEVTEKESRKVGRMVLCVGETTYRTIHGERVGTYVSRGLRTPRPAGGRKLHSPRRPHRYTAEDLRQIERELLAQTRRGAANLFWEDLCLGDEAPALVKGPLDVATMACFHAGLGPLGYAPIDLALRRQAADRLASSLALPSPPKTVRPGRGGGDGHDDPVAARASGMPGAFDIGWQRISWMAQVLTDWIGDRGCLKMIDVKLVSPNIIGDTLRCKSKVTAKKISRDQGLIDLDLRAERQDGQVSAVGTATVILPHRGLAKS